jgi:hypothetical protein
LIDLPSANVYITSLPIIIEVELPAINNIISTHKQLALKCPICSLPSYCCKIKNELQFINNFFLKYNVHSYSEILTPVGQKSAWKFEYLFSSHIKRNFVTQEEFNGIKTYVKQGKTFSAQKNISLNFFNLDDDISHFYSLFRSCKNRVVDKSIIKYNFLQSLLNQLENKLPHN